MKAIVAGGLAPCDLKLLPLKNLVTGVKDFEARFGPATTLEEDLLTFGSAVYATDLAFKRSEREEFIRDIELTVPVVNYHAFERAKQDIEEALYTLSCDNWSLKFVHASGAPEKSKQRKSKKGAALLFSGGLDSLCEAGRLYSGAEPVLLVSHITHNRVIENAQTTLLKALEKTYGCRGKRLAYRVFARSVASYPFPKDAEREETQRTRSMLFLILAALSARRFGFERIIYIAENGQFAIHLPLNSARVGPFSTHTAHPHFTALMQNVLRTLLGSANLSIENPFLYMTKSEVLASVDKQVQKSFPISISCWRASRLSSKHHCGECIPCLTRRIALEALAIPQDEYERDLLAERVGELDSEDLGKRNLADLMEFVLHFYRYTAPNRDRLIENFPELRNPFFNEDKAIEMYVRFSKEAMRVFAKYKGLKPLLR